MNNYRLHFIVVLAMDVSNSLSARQAFNTGSLFFLILSMICLAVAGYFFIRLMEDQVGIIVNATWIALGTTSVTVASYFVYGEVITWLQAMGMLLIVAGIIMTEYYSPKEVEEPIPNDQ